MENGINITGTVGTFFEQNCNESCPRNKYLKGGCDCDEQLRLVAEFKRDIVHEKFEKMFMGVGA